MLPATSMPRYDAMPQTTSLESYIPFRHHADSPRYHHPLRDATPQHLRAFPIRTSQSHRRAAAASVSPYPPRSEHHLRRKTPNGILDAAYDGSPAQLNPDIPPHKHMILPASAHTYQQLPSGNLPEPQRSSLLVDTQASILRDRIGPNISAWSSNNEPWRQYGMPLGASNAFLPYQPNLLGNPAMFPTVYQPVARANEYNVRAFCPPPIPTSEALLFGQGGWQPSSFTWNRQLSGYNRGSYGNVDFPDQPMPYNRLIGEDFTLPNVPYPSNHALAYKTSRATHLDLDSLNLTSDRHLTANSHNVNYDDQPRFRERALSHAHRTYIDLLTHLQTVRRAQQARGGNGTHPPFKPLVYPKPPNPSSFNLTYPHGNTHVASQSFKNTQGVPDKNGYVPSRVGASSVPNTTRPIMHPTGYSMQPDAFGSASQSRNIHQGLQMTPFYGDFSSKAPPVDKPQPILSARSSLEVLTSLCEQSGWKWINGMLLGGCLHYGLENYDEALQWFYRITALETSHVEAITNIAATLFCLDRIGEAEQQWLKAVKLCPAYLEAAEHLVGLLYRKRSKKAIEVITFVQQSLRLSPSQMPQGASSASIDDISLARDAATKISDDTFSINTFGGRTRRSVAGAIPEAQGFGSSGYALPGSENARILALVHAKGTMLYSLKEIDQASEAFEEAVLISVGRRINGIHDLVRRIQIVLSPVDSVTGPRRQLLQQPSQPLLLPPERARQTAYLAFGGNGELPGLLYVAEGVPKRAATQTTSNSLLSLAKIFQDAMSGGTTGPKLLQRSSGVSDILSLYYLSLSLQESPSTANNVGILLAGVQQGTPQNLSSNIKHHHLSQPALPGVQAGSGLALALAYYQYGLRLDPKHVHLHTNLGSLLKDIGQLDLAIQMYEQAVSCDGNFDIALTNLANAVKDRGRVNDAIMYYKRAVRANPDFAEAVCGLFTALNSVCDWKGRGGVMLYSGKYDRWHVGEDGMLLDGRNHEHGSGLTKKVVDIVTRQLGEASQWGCNTLKDDVIHVFAQQLSDICEATVEDLEYRLRAWRRKPWEGSRVLRLVERATRVTLWKWYHDKHTTRKRTNTRYIRPRLPLSLTVPSAPTVLPFHTFTCPLRPNYIRSISQRNANRISCSTLRSPWLPATVYPPPSPPSPHLNIGYVSSDFNNHPLAHLMQSVFGFHDTSRARAFCYATTASDKSCYRRQIEREAPVFRDASTWSSDKLVEQIVTDNIHILVNLNGYTRGARNEVFAARPAPIQMSFMGFAGTLGAEWCDYILADSTAIPVQTLRPWRKNTRVEDIFHDDTEGEADDWVYSENIIFCRDTFFCCDHAQSCDASERQVTWQEEKQRRWKMRRELFPDLSDDTIILGNFNQLYKIEPTTFRSWLRILARVPKAILWLLRFPELGEANLRATAKLWAGSEVASRLVFTDVAPKNQHISRARVCDLFLDTPECNAHTTAADVLWSSTPLLTLPRYPYKMCSRMAASILKGALPKTEEGRQVASELIAESDAEYEQAAIRLAGGLRYNITSSGVGEGIGRLAEMRKILWQSKWQCGLFDTRRWVDEVERAYEEAWRRWVSGEGGDIYL